MERQDYDEYVAARNRGALKALLIKVGLRLTTHWVFSLRLRNAFYRLLGVGLPRDTNSVYIAREVLIDDNFPELVTIEEGAALSWRVMLLCHDVVNEKRRIVGPIHIKRDAKIGAGTIVLPGLTIGEHAQIGAGAIVRKDVPDYGLVIGPVSTCNWLR